MILDLTVVLALGFLFGSAVNRIRNDHDWFYMIDAALVLFVYSVWIFFRV